MTSVSQVETPSPTGPILHTSQAAVEQQIGSAFSRRFQGANGTPFLSPPCSIALAWMAPQLQPAASWQAPSSAPQKWMNLPSSLSLPSANPQSFPPYTPVHLCFRFSILLGQGTGMHILLLFRSTLWPL